MSSRPDQSNSLSGIAVEREPEELTDEELEYVVGGLDPTAAIMRLQTLLGGELGGATE
jgi:hypothetical protein